jgi:murein DD-endopeptidase MepM/ murein hydrolase activator NlpD
MPVRASALAPTGAEKPAMASTVFRLPVPAPATVLTPFRAPATRYGPGHRGADLALAVGSQVLAAGAGVVTHAGAVAGRGTVTVEHPDGLHTTYEPVTATVRTGQVVTAGQPIGVLQAGHASCAPASCLHWGARLPDGSYVDPMGLVDGLRVRLLPWDQARG